MKKKIKNFLMLIKKSLMNNKKGLELSINFIVIIVISIIIFIFGVRFIYQLSSEATNLKDITLEELDQRIGKLACEGSEKVCFGFDKKVIKRNNFDIFGMRIINILDSRDFEIKVVKPSAYYGYTKEGNTITTDYLEVKPTLRIEHIEKNAEKDFAIGVEVQKNAESGTYILDVIMCYDDGNVLTEDLTSKCTTPSYLDLYSFDKIYVDVP